MTRSKRLNLRSSVLIYTICTSGTRLHLAAFIPLSHKIPFMKLCPWSALRLFFFKSELKKTNWSSQNICRCIAVQEGDLKWNVCCHPTPPPPIYNKYPPFWFYSWDKLLTWFQLFHTCNWCQMRCFWVRSRPGFGLEVVFLVGRVQPFCALG